MTKTAIRFDVFALGGDMIDVTVTFIHPPLLASGTPFVRETGKLRMSFKEWGRLQALRTWGQDSPESESEAFFHGGAKGLIQAASGTTASMGMSMPHITGRNDCCDTCAAGVR